MNRPKATRLRLFLATAAVAAFAAFLPGTASADFGVYFGPAGYPNTPTPSGVTVSFADSTPGAHSDITVNHHYGYTGVPSGVAANSGDDLKQWILETPAGFYGNPSAVPFDQRCTQYEMNAYVKNQPMPGYLGFPGSRCPASAQVGTAQLTLGVDANGATGAVLDGKIYVVQSASPLQEVPTTLFTVFETTVSSCSSAPVTNCITAALSKTQIAPVTGGDDADYRLRSVSEMIDRPDLSAAQNQAAHTTEGQYQGDPADPLGRSQRRQSPDRSWRKPRGRGVPDQPDNLRRLELTRVLKDVRVNRRVRLGNVSAEHLADRDSDWHSHARWRRHQRDVRRVRLSVDDGDQLRKLSGTHTIDQRIGRQQRSRRQPRTHGHSQQPGFRQR